MQTAMSTFKVATTDNNWRLTQFSISAPDVDDTMSVPAMLLADSDASGGQAVPTPSNTFT